MCWSKYRPNGSNLKKINRHFIERGSDNLPICMRSLSTALKWFYKIYTKLRLVIFPGIFYKYSAVELLTGSIKLKELNATADNIVSCAGMCNGAFLEDSRYFFSQLDDRELLLD